MLGQGISSLELDLVEHDKPRAGLSTKCEK